VYKCSKMPLENVYILKGYPSSKSHGSAKITLKDF
jgi:hypothetical protein